MNDLSLISPSFDKQIVNSYTLSVKLRFDGLSFCVFDVVTNTFVALGNTDFEEPDMNFARQEEFMACNELFSYNYKRTLVSIDSQTFTMMPSSLFDEQKARSVLEFLGAKPAPDDRIVGDTVSIADDTIVYYLPQFLYYFLQSQFANLRLMHCVEPVVEAMLTKRLATDRKNTVNIVVENTRMYILVAEGNRLKLSNFYDTADVSDMVYAVMNTLDQLNINNDDTSVTVSGNIDERSELFRLLSRFAHNVRMASLPLYFQYGFQVPDEQRFVNLFLMSLCE